jgi:hypothetical protein
MNATLWSLLAFLLAGRSLAAAEPPRSQEFRLRGGADKLALVDADADGLEDLLIARQRRLELHLQARAAGFRFENPEAALDLPGAAVAWDLERGGGASWRILAVVDGRELWSWTYDAGARRFTERRIPVDGLAAFVPRGAQHLRFLRDIDGDGDRDLVLPGPGAIQTFLAEPGGGYVKGPSAAADLALEARLDVDETLGARAGRSLRLPDLDLRDVNGDRLNDLVSRTEDRLEVHFARDRGRFSAVPDIALDIAQRQKRLGTIDPDKIDFSNLTGLLAYTLETKFQDIDGDGIADVLLREGGKVSVFLGKAAGIDFEKPDQVLKSAGNVVTAALSDENEDGRPDLFLWRIEAVSIGDVFVWLVASGSLDLEAFIYLNEGRAFARRPSRKLTLTLRFPSFLKMLDLAGEIEKRLAREAKVVMEGCDLARAGARRDLLVLQGGTLRAYLGEGARAGRRETTDLLQLLDYRRDHDDYELDLEVVADKLLFGRDEALKLLEEKPAAFSIALPGAGRDNGLFVLDLDGDGIDDALVIYQNDAEALAGAVALSRRG